MKIRMLVAIAGAHFSLGPGDETERFSDAEVERFVAAGIAETCIGACDERVADAVIEVAAVEPTERATSRRKKV